MSFVLMISKQADELHKTALEDAGDLADGASIINDKEVTNKNSRQKVVPDSDNGKESDKTIMQPDPQSEDLNKASEVHEFDPTLFKAATEKKHDSKLSKSDQVNAAREENDNLQGYKHDQ